MKRAIITPAALPGAALAEVRQWLGITTSADDAPLQALLAAALEICEGFTGQMPLEAECEELLPATTGGWQRLATRPVLAITTVESLADDGSRTALNPADYEMELDADGGGRVRLPCFGSATGAGRLAVRFTAGLADDWDALPASLRHGLVRLAAHQHRERENAGGAALPPASVAALWRPWRRMRLE